MKLSSILKMPYTAYQKRKQNKSFDEINAKLEKALRMKRAKQNALMYDMRIYLRKFLKVGSASKFIPLDLKSNAEIIKATEKKYGKRMAALDVSLDVTTMEIIAR